MSEIKWTGVLITALRIFIKRFQPGHRFDTSIVSLRRIDYAPKTRSAKKSLSRPVPDWLLLRRYFKFDLSFDLRRPMVVQHK